MGLNYKALDSDSIKIKKIKCKVIAFEFVKNDDNFNQSDLMERELT